MAPALSTAYLHLGTVMLSDGTPLTDRAKIERVCNGVRMSRRTDKKGRFSIEVGRSLKCGRECRFRSDGPRHVNIRQRPNSGGIPAATWVF